jgi:hypothetical protein
MQTSAELGQNEVKRGNAQAGLKILRSLARMGCTALHKDYEPDQTKRFDQFPRLRLRTHLSGAFALGRTPRRRSTSSEPTGSRRSRNATESWAIGRLTELADSGSLSAGRELLHRVIRQCERASGQRPELLDPALCRWLKDFLGRAANNTRDPVGDLIAASRPQHGRGRRIRPRTHAELVHDMSLAQEAYVRVKQGIDAGAFVKTVCESVANELNALGYRSARKEPLTWSFVRARYYEVRGKRETDRRLAATPRFEQPHSS